MFKNWKLVRKILYSPYSFRRGDYIGYLYSPFIRNIHFNKVIIFTIQFINENMFHQKSLEINYISIWIYWFILKLQIYEYCISWQKKIVTIMKTICIQHLSIKTLIRCINFIHRIKILIRKSYKYILPMKN